MNSLSTALSTPKMSEPQRSAVELGTASKGGETPIRGLTRTTSEESKMAKANYTAGAATRASI